MIERKYKLPSTVDEAIGIILSDLTMQNLIDFSNLNHENYIQLCNGLVPHLEYDFKVWLGNEKLLLSCLEDPDCVDITDPMMVIMDRLRDRIRQILDIDIIFVL